MEYTENILLISFVHNQPSIMALSSQEQIKLPTTWHDRTVLLKKMMVAGRWSNDTKNSSLCVSITCLVVPLLHSICVGLLLLVIRFWKPHLHRFFRSRFLAPALVVTVDEVQYQLYGPQPAPEAIGHLQHHSKFPSNNWNFSHFTLIDVKSHLKSFMMSAVW